MQRYITLFVLLTSLLSAHAQDTTTADAEQAAQKARAAAAAAAEMRKKITVKGRETAISEDFLRVIKEQQEEKHKNRLRAQRRTENDSTRWVRNQYKRFNYPHKWFAGGNIVANVLVADNITDHPPFRYFSDAVGLGLEAYVGRTCLKNLSVRAGLGIHNTKNRVDRETVEDAWLGYHLYEGHGYYRFTTIGLFGDVMFDVTGCATSEWFHPLHVNVFLGVGVASCGKKKLKGTWLIDPIPNADKMITGHESAASFEHRVNPSSNISFGGRMGLNFDYRVSKNMSIDLELMATVTDDSFEGIKFDEPFDIFMKCSLGARYYFNTK